MPYEAVFELNEAACELTYKNDRIEKHGEEGILACDLGFTFETNNGVLAMFAPALRSALYMKGESSQTSLVNDDDHLTALRFPAIAGGKPIAWGAGELEAAELKFHWGIGGKSDVVFEKVKIGKYKLECLEGGTVTLHFQAQVNPTDQQTAFLSKALVNKICTISISNHAA